MDQKYVSRELLNICKQVENSVQNEIMQIIHDLEIGITDSDRDAIKRLEEMKQNFSLLQREMNTYTIEAITDDLEDKVNSTKLLEIETVFFKTEQDFSLEMQAAEFSFNGGKLLKETLINSLMVDVRNNTKSLKTFDAFLKHLQNEAEKLNKVIEQQKIIIHILQEKLSQTSPSQNKTYDMLKRKDRELNRLLNIRITKLGELLSKYFPPPDEYELESVIKNGNSQKDWKSMLDILDLLLQKHMETPHDPWVIVDDTFWISYLNTLKLAGVIRCNSKNKCLIALDL